MDINEQISLERLELKEAVSEALKVADKLGADAAEVAITKQVGISVSTRQSEVENIEFNRDGALGIAVYSGQSKGSASTSDLRPEAIRSAVEAAVEFSRHTSVDPCAGIAERERMAWEAPELDLYHSASLEPEQGIELAAECERLALSQDPRVAKSDGASFNSHTGIKVYGNSHGFIDSYVGSRHSLSCVLIGESGGQMQRDYSYSVARDLNKLWTPQRIADEAVERTASRLGARKIETQSVPVLFRADVASGLFGHLVGAISGSSLYRKSSFLLDSLGKQIFPDWLNITEDPHIKGALASTPFDSEGVLTEKRQIIKGGCLESYLLTSYSARRLGMQTTGHAGGIYNWQVSSTGQDFTAMLRELGTGLLVTELMGQGVNGVTGDYSRGAAGFWVENGEIAFPVQEITIAGNLKEMFQDIRAIGTDQDERATLKTGSILLEKMKIAGH
ncbi:metalloprotease PmbA [Dongshaea marina]|uniref:metalloprotease PmbA n=1 Tax=Dongshaea marina TaxID=2047966 RepID=UPI000D3E7068|nr:metalloprotease PmbA [Dongshaea marina]